MSGTIWNIPNILTLARIALIPVFLLIAYWPPAIGFMVTREAYFGTDC